MTQLTYRVPQPSEQAELEALLDAALHLPTGTTNEMISAMGLEAYRAVYQNQRVVAGLGCIPMGHWFGGKSVPAAGITVVGVAPDTRGSGVGSMLLSSTLRDLREQGYPLASLYPATLRFYRRFGFERAGNRITYELPLDLVDVAPSPLTLEPFGPESYEVVRAIYNEAAQRSAGLIDRPDWMWQRRLEAPGRQVYRFLAKRGDKAEGYIVYTQGSRTDPITVLDTMSLTPDAARCILTMLANYRTMVEHALWTGGSLDQLAYVVAEQHVQVGKQRVKVARRIDWMLRIVDVVKALEARGYSPGIDAELSFELYDTLLPENAGRWTLRVADQRAEVRPGGEPHIQLSERDLAAIYTGFITPQECAYLGTIRGSNANLALAGTIFNGPRPWIAEMF
jgi:predicted acetyltransferase